MKSALFIPNYLGGGFGHIGRCLALAQALVVHGVDSSFVMNGPHAATVAKAGFKIDSVSLPPVSQKGMNAPAYIYVPEMSYQIVRDGFDNQHRVRAVLSELTAIVKRTNPDVIIGDGYPITWMLGRRTGVPVVQFVKSAVHPATKQMIWWEGEPEGLKVPDVRPVFNPVLHDLDLPVITRGAEELLQGDLLLLPSIPVLDPMNTLPQNTYYVGPIIRNDEGSQSMADFFRLLNPKKPVVFVTVGGAAGNGGFVSFFNTALKAFRDEDDYQVVISTGGKTDPASLGPTPEHIMVVRWVPGLEMIARSNAVVFHGGYTRMEILIHGLPSVVIPFHSEQEYYGRVMERAGVGTLVHFSDQPYKRLTRRWKGGNRWLKLKEYTVHVKPEMTLDAVMLRNAVTKCLNDQAMCQRAKTLQQELTSSGGCNKAIELIKNRLF